MHIRRRVVEPKPHVSLIAGLRQLLHDVLAIRSVRNLVVRIGGIEHAKAVMMFRRKHHVFLACGARQINKRIGIELCGVKALR